MLGLIPGNLFLGLSHVTVLVQIGEKRCVLLLPKRLRILLPLDRMFALLSFLSYPLAAGWFTVGQFFSCSVNSDLRRSAGDSLSSVVAPLSITSISASSSVFTSKRELIHFTPEKGGGGGVLILATANTIKDQSGMSKWSLKLITVAAVRRRQWGDGEKKETTAA